MENQLVTKSNGAMPQALNSFSDVDARDLVLPRLLLMQGLSEMVTEEKAKMGEILNSLTGEVLGGRGKPVEIIPFFLTRNFIVSEKLGDKFEWRGNVAADHTNAHWKEQSHREEMVNGVLTRRDYSMDFFALLADEAGQEDALPVQISFRRTSLKAGKQLYTRFLLTKGKPTTTWLLDSKKKENDQGTFYVLEVTRGKPLTDKQRQACEAALSLVGSGQIKVDGAEMSEGRNSEDVPF